MYLPSTFFDLSSFPHRSLFLEQEPAWKTLPLIESYLKSIPLGKIEVPIPEGAYLDHPEQISIGKGTLLEPGCYIKGPCIIGENCTIRHGAYIRGGLITGNHCIIGHATEVKNAIFLTDVRASHFAYVADSIIGNHVNLGAGVKCSNLRLDHGLIKLHVEGEEIETGLRKFGAIIGDACQLGCNSVTNPGTLMGRRVYCFPCLNLGGVIAQDQIVKEASLLTFKSHTICS